MSVNYKLATTRAYEFLLSEEFLLREDFNMYKKLSNFPLPLKDYAMQEHRLVSYTNLAKEMGITYLQLKKLLKKSWGTVIRNNYSYTIAYDDQLNEGAQLFTIAHEIGHIEMGHLVKEQYRTALFRIEENYLLSPDSELYKEMDQEADCFARNLLCPIQLLRHMKRTYSAADLSQLFGITLSAAKSRINFAKNDLYYSNDIDSWELVARYFDFLKHIEDTYTCTASNLYIQQEFNNFLFSNASDFTI